MVTLGTFFNIRRRVLVFVCTISTAMLGVDFIGTKSIIQAQILQIPVTSCLLGTETTTFNPPLKNEVQENSSVTLNGSVGGCINGEGITSGTYNFSFTASTSCDKIGFFPTYQIKYKWNPTHQTSLVQYTTTTRNTVKANYVVISSGTVLEGVFKNRMVERTVTVPTTDITACSDKGISSITGLQTLTILPALP